MKTSSLWIRIKDSSIIRESRSFFRSQLHEFFSLSLYFPYSLSNRTNQQNAPTPHDLLSWSNQTFRHSMRFSAELQSHTSVRLASYPAMPEGSEK